MSTHNDGLNRGHARNTNLAPMTIEFYPIMEQAGSGINFPCRENLAKLKAALSYEVKCLVTWETISPQNRCIIAIGSVQEMKNELDKLRHKDA